MPLSTLNLIFSVKLCENIYSILLRQSTTLNCYTNEFSPRSPFPQKDDWKNYGQESNPNMEIYLICDAKEKVRPFLVTWQPRVSESLWSEIRQLRLSLTSYQFSVHTNFLPNLIERVGGWWDWSPNESFCWIHSYKETYHSSNPICTLVVHYFIFQSTSSH